MRKNRRWRGLALVGFIGAALVAWLVMRQARSAYAGPVRLSDMPGVMLWAWERPENLRFLDGTESGVAYLAETIYLAQEPSGAPGDYRFSIRPRLQPLVVGPDTARMAVIRIETTGEIAGKPSGGGQQKDSSEAASQRERIAGVIAEVARRPGIRGIQIDFDARKSEQEFYGELLKSVRREMPPEMPLSITALASWCIGDRWLEKLPAGTVDEAVPMLFRMGVNTGDVRRFLHSGREFPVKMCSGSVGLSTDEEESRELLAQAATRWRGKRIYVFAPEAWTEASAEAVLRGRNR